MHLYSILSVLYMLTWFHVCWSQVHSAPIFRLTPIQPILSTHYWFPHHRGGRVEVILEILEFSTRHFDGELVDSRGGETHSMSYHHLTYITCHLRQECYSLCKREKNTTSLINTRLCISGHHTQGNFEVINYLQQL